MGRLVKTHRERLDKFLRETDHILDQLGKPFIPELQDRVVEFMKPFIEEVQEGKMKPSSFLKNSYGHFWREISDLIAGKFPELHKPIPRSLDNRTKAKFFWDRTYCHDILFKFDCYDKIKKTDAYAIVEKWRIECNIRSTAETKHRLGCKFEWGNPEYDALHVLAMQCLSERSKSATDSDRCVELIYALTFFTGRRPWEEVGRISVFREAEGPEEVQSEHADDWLEVEGIGKKADDFDDKLTIPVFNISSAELVEGLIELRMIEAGKSWFSMSREKGASASTDIIGSLGYKWNQFARERVDHIFERPLSLGYNFDHNASKGRGHSRFNAYDLRRMYCSYGFWRYNEWCVENKFKPWSDAIPWAKTYLGHADSKAENQTQTYLGFTFRGDGELTDVSDFQENPFAKRHEVTG